MDKTITFTLEQLLIWVLLIAAIVAVIILISVLVKASAAMKGLNDTLTNANKLLENTNDIVADVKEVTHDTKLTIKKAENSVEGFCKIIDDNKNSITAITNLANAGASLASLFKGKSK